MSKLWVRVESEISSFHGPSLQVKILPDEFARNQDSVCPPLRARMTGPSSSPPDANEEEEEAEEDYSASTPPQITDLTSALVNLTISKMNMEREEQHRTTSSVVINHSFSHQQKDPVRVKLEQAVSKLAEKARMYTMRAKKFKPGSEKHTYWTEKANTAVSNSSSIVHSLFWDSKKTSSSLHMM